MLFLRLYWSKIVCLQASQGETPGLNDTAAGSFLLWTI